MAKKISFTFSNISKNGVVETSGHPCDYAAELLGNLSTGNKKFSAPLRSASGFEVRGLYLGMNEDSFRLEYILPDDFKGDFILCAETLRSAFNQECVLYECQGRSYYSAWLVYEDKTEEI